MANILTGSITGAAPTQANVGTGSALAVAFNANRAGIYLTNLSTGTIYLAFGANAAVIGSGVVLSPNNGSWTMAEYSFTKEQINAIAHVSNSGMSIQEFNN